LNRLVTGPRRAQKSTCYLSNRNNARPRAEPNSFASSVPSLSRSAAWVPTAGRMTSRCRRSGRVCTRCGKKVTGFRLNPMIIRPGRFRLSTGNFCCKSSGGRFAMASDLPSPAREVAQTSDRAGLAPWSSLSWGVFIPAVFAGNLVLAIFAWFVVEWAMTQF
jgi:hypothetical protein